MLHDIINEQGHWLDVRNDVSGKSEYISHVFLAKISSLWGLNLRYWWLLSPCTFVTDVMNICFQYFLIWIILK